MIALEGSARERNVWHALLDLSEKAQDWAVVGARMVELHAFEHGKPPRRVSLDGDALADARVRPNPVRLIAQLLVAEGFELTDVGILGTGHTFVRDGVTLDLLAPENLGPNSERARITIPPLHTVEVPGGRQALDRKEWVDVSVDRRNGRLPRPNLLGAILIKARAVDVDDVPEDQRSDLALLLSLVDDPEAMAAQLRGEEHNWLVGRSEIDDPRAACWIGLSDDDVQKGVSALRILTGA